MDTAVGRWIRFFLFLMLLAGIVALMVILGDLVRLVIIAALLAYILDPIVSRIEAYGLGRTAATGILYLGLILIVGGTVWLLLPFIRGEIEALRNTLTPETTSRLMLRLEQFITSTLPFLKSEELDLTNRAVELLVSYGNTLLQNLAGLVTLVTNLILVPFLVFFFLKDGRALKKYCMGLLPNRYFEFSLTLLHKMDMQLGNYLRGQLLDALLVGILSCLALWILEVKYFLLIGFFAGMANLIPYIGPATGALVAVFVSFTDTGSFGMALPILMAFGGVQLIDNAVIQPNVVARTVNLTPLVVLIAVIVGGRLFGILGMILSVPATAILKVTLEEGLRIYRKYRFA